LECGSLLPLSLSTAVSAALQSASKLAHSKEAGACAEQPEGLNSRGCPW